MDNSKECQDGQGSHHGVNLDAVDFAVLQEAL